jgi:NAD(P)-dependent dehydrogenase (short-subunit alcohol dehydrogenase family)
MEISNHAVWEAASRAGAFCCYSSAMKEMVGKIALITGANRGIGLEIASQLATRGFHVIVGSRSAEAGEKTAQAIGAKGGLASSLHLDVSSSTSVRAAAEEFPGIADHLDVLINNAGIYPDEGLSILTIGRQQLAATFHTNTFGPIEVVQAFLPFLRRAGATRIINISSGYGQLDGLSPGVPSYCLSKLALNGVTLMLSEALKSDGIAVNSMCPGWVRTDMGGPGATRSVQEGADTAVWLATEAPQGLTGKFLRDRKPIDW